MKNWYLVSVIVSSLVLWACDGTETPTNTATPSVTTQSESAAITAVAVTGEPGNYTFGVTIESPDTGCDQYADWWEVIRADGSLVYRRILAHSHVNEQPFSRSGSPVTIAPDEETIVRVHMNNSGYGEQVIRGSVEQGLMVKPLETSFSAELETTAPLPDGCAF